MGFAHLKAPTCQPTPISPIHFHIPTCLIKQGTVKSDPVYLEF